MTNREFDEKITDLNDIGPPINNRAKNGRASSMNIDNVTIKLGEDLKKNLDNHSKMNLCAAYFSMFAFKELKKELSKIKEFNFLFNSPTFLKEENTNKKQKEFFIPQKKELKIRKNLKKFNKTQDPNLINNIICQHCKLYAKNIA